jgi:uncharacterized protein YjbI with pentapeptide repeats
VESSNTVIVSVMVKEKGKQAEERQDEPRLWRPWRPPRRRRGWRVLWAIGMVVALLTTALLTVKLYPEIWKGLLEARILTLIAIGVSVTAIIVLLAIGGASLGWTGFGDKQLWDWLQLLSALAIPVVLAAAGLWFTAQQDQRQQEIEGQRAKQAQKIEDQRAKAERDLAEQRAQDEALQAYLTQMSTLLLEKNLRTSGSSEEDRAVRTLARARTLTVLRRLDSEHNSDILQFLREAQLISGTDPVIRLNRVNLSGAELSGVDLSGVDLSGADLSDADLTYADLESANLSGATMVWVRLRFARMAGANLSDAWVAGANLRHTGLIDANLSGAELDGAKLSSADLIEADLSDAYLFEADLRGANLSDADLGGADLSHATGVTDAKLKKAQTLEGATMPNGQKYEDWLKSKGRKEDGKSGGSS